MNAIIIGATGLVGAQILKFAESSSSVARITTLTRRAIDGEVASSPKLNSVVKTSLDDWVGEIAKTEGKPDVFFSAFGTTKADAGGTWEKYKEIDHGTQLKCAQAAREANISCFVLVSASSASEEATLAYARIKADLEHEIKQLGFPRLIILRPGALLGQRTRPKGFVNAVVAKVGSLTRGTILDWLLKPVYAEEIGKVAVSLATKPSSAASAEKEVIILTSQEIIALAKEL